MKQKINLKDFLFLSIFPLAISLPLLLDSVNALKLWLHNPQIWQYFTSSFIHQNFTHYINLLVLMIVLLLSQLVLASKAKQKKQYYSLLLFTFLTFPFLSSLIQVFVYPIAFPFLQNISGSSGLVSAMFGFIPILSACVARTYRRKEITIIPILYFSLLYIEMGFLILYYNSTLVLIALTITLILLLYSLQTFKKEYLELLRGIKRIRREEKALYYLIICLSLLFLLTPILIFPIQVIQKNFFIDFIIHFFGITYGLAVSYVFFR